MLELKVDKNGQGHCYPCMGCRSFLTPYVDPETNEPKYYGRFNQGVVTINLPDVALSSGGNIEKFWKIFDERLELCHRALMCRHERLKGTLSDAAPILWQYGACARLKKGEPIDKLLYGGYSTISLGYAGLYECVKYMTGKSHTDPTATPFALEIMEHMNAACRSFWFTSSDWFSVKAYFTAALLPTAAMFLILLLAGIILPSSLFWIVYIIQIINLAIPAPYYCLACGLLKKKPKAALIRDEKDAIGIWTA